MRKARAKKRILLPDPKFKDTTVTRFVNNMMWDGKKETARTDLRRENKREIISTKIKN